MLRRIAIITGFAVLGGCTIADTGPSLSANPSLGCTPIDPRAQLLPAKPCFRAVRYAGNEITLQWQVTNSKPSVYIYNDSGTGVRAVEKQNAYCASNSSNICSTTVSVKQGGFHRWLLQVDHPRSGRVYVATSISIPSPFAPVITSRSDFVDMLKPTPQTLTWQADQRNAHFNLPLERAWIELKQPDSPWNTSDRLPRSGPQAQLTVPASALTKPGRNIFNIRDCRLPADSGTTFCSDAVPVGLYLGSDRFLERNPIHAPAGQDLEISFTTRSGDVRRLFSKTLLTEKNRPSFLATPEASYTIPSGLLTPGSHKIELKSCQEGSDNCSPGHKLDILISSTVAPVSWTLDRDYRDDFRRGNSYGVLGRGAPLDITYDPSGGIWLINEFSTSIEHVSAQGEVKSFTVPLARRTLSTTSSKLVKPFASLATRPAQKPVNFSSLAERATNVGSTLWFTQGGGMMGPVVIGNHSRVISYDPTKSDAISTPFDDRICVYNIPTDDKNGYGNNQVIGLTAARNRIWVGENRGHFDKKPSAISSFIPNIENCGNLLDFDDPTALANQRLQYCTEGKTPEQDACMEKYLLDELPPGLKVAHLATDPVDDSVWFTDMRGRYIGNLNPDRPEAIEIYPIENTHSELGWFGGFPWSIRVDAEAVYVGEFRANHLLRFDKAKAKFHEIQIPVASLEIRLHSIDIDIATNRLWFTLSNNSQMPLDNLFSTIGYIDLNSWRNHVVSPVDNETIYGVIYKDLYTIAAPETNPSLPQSFNGIAIDPASGKIAIATMRRKQITELTPNASFWP
ncbi:MAG: hypothetical protein ACI9JM_001179 [Halioglobus sp.]|jgi:hypothetical protein